MLAWHFLPEGWALVNAWTGGWLGTLWYVVTLPFVLLSGLLRAFASAIAWVVGVVDNTFHVAAAVQAVLLPVWALLAGRCVGRDGEKEGALLWLGAAGVHALCAVLLGYPMMALMVVVGGLGAFVATMALRLSFRSWTGWLAMALAAGLMAWGMERYGVAFEPVCWPLVPLSCCLLVLGAAWGTRCEAVGRLRHGGAARLVLLAMAMAMAAVGPSAVRAARAAAFLPGGVSPAPTLTAPAIAAPAPTGREAAVTAAPARQPAPAAAQRRSGRDAKQVSPSQSKHPRT